jgi:hypothetical protein
MPARVRWAYVVLVLLFTATALVVVSITYTRHVQHQTEQTFQRAQQMNNRRWCALLSSLDQPDVPATTERGRQVQIQIHQLRLGLGCGVTP